jgi:hypothetical protein
MPGLLRSFAHRARAAISNASTPRSRRRGRRRRQRDLEVDDREADERTAGSADLMPFSTPGIYSFGTAPPTIFVLEDEARTRSPGVDGQLHAGELARTARLLLVGVVDVTDASPSVFAVGHLRRADIGLDLELARMRSTLMSR